MADYTQTGKPIRVTTPLGPDVLLIERMHGVEGVSQPFELTLDLLSTDEKLDPKTLLRKPVTVTVDLKDGEEGGERYFNGIVRRFVQLGRDPTFVSYRAEVVPTFWLLSLTTDCRIFQQKTVIEIVKDVFDKVGLTDVRWACSGSYPKREYCVQYRETHLNFVSRLLEEEGIFFFFEHTQDKHTMVIADATSAVKPGPVAKLPVTVVKGGNLNHDAIIDFELNSEVVSGKTTLNDYNFETPSLTLSSTVAGGNAGTSAEMYRKFDYPGNFKVVADGDRLARVRLEEEETLGTVVRALTNYRGLASGQKLEVDEHYRRDLNGQYHVISASHDATQSSYNSAAQGDIPFNFTTSFEAIPYATHFRPPRVTPKAIVHGTQPAVVVGPSGEEIYVDKYSRVKVQFFWDQQGKKDENSSCWVRVSTGWAGKTWGIVHIPRIGQEVLVDFLEGDPDRPIITGRVYNAEQMPPYPLPANMTQSGVKSRSSKSGDTSNFNELRFEDLKGSEHIFFHAEKDSMIEVENNETHSVGNDRTKTIDHDETTHVKHDRTETVDNNETITIHGTRTETVDKDETITLHATRTETVDKDETITIKGKRTETVEKDETVTVNTGNRTVKIKTGNEALEVSTGNMSTKVAMGNVSTKVDMGNVDTSLGMGNMTTKASLGAVNTEAMQGIELKVGGNSIKIDQTGVTIKGLMITIEGQVQTQIKGLMTQVNASAILQVKGALTMIN